MQKMQTKFSESANGYPVIELEPPYELIGEFLRALHTVDSAEQLEKLLSDVADGNVEQAEFPQDYALLTLRGHDGSAHIWVDDLSRGEERQIEVPLKLFAGVVQEWIVYLRSRRGGTGERV
jgi:hypothetical protein